MKEKRIQKQFNKNQIKNQGRIFNHHDTISFDKPEQVAVTI